jgi:putative Mg2+ transporter-C (MgtC) family protein
MTVRGSLTKMRKRVPMELNPATPLQAIDLDLILRLGIPAALGLLLGLDREVRGYAAGLRTHGLVCFTAAVMTVSVIALFNQLNAANTRIDPLRLYEGAAAFSGIIAAGLIVFSKGTVRNMTTAVHLWLATVIGIACGAAQWPLVVLSVVVAVTMLTILRIFEKRWIDPEAERLLDKD